jgi:hypothetical protein
MGDAYTKLDQALKDLIEAYTEIESELDDKHGDDEESFSTAIIEVLETAVESAIDEQDSDTRSIATILSNLSEALEQLDPSAFDAEETEDADEDEEEDEDYDIDDDDEDLEELDEEEDEDD